MKRCLLWCKSAAIYGLHTEVGRIFVFSLLINILVECLNHRNLWGLAELFVNPVVFLYNTLIIMLTMCVSLFTRRKIFAGVTIGGIWVVLAVINFVVLSSRKTPFTAMDIYLIQDAIKVIPVYLNVFQIILIAAAVIAGIAGLVFLWIKGPKAPAVLNLKSRLLWAAVKTAVVGVLVLGLTLVLIPMGVLGRNFGNLGNAYKQYGFAYCFSCSVVGRGISKSDDYSEEYMDGIKEQLDTSQGVENSQSHPNIIFVQLESFFNPERIKGVKFSSDPLPNFKKYSTEYSAGYISVPCFGAGTANTEFEVQTGINLDDFGPGEYPYKTVLQSAICESAAYNLKSLGYSTHALHNNDGTFYNRNKVFSHLGYDSFTSVEYMTNIEYTPTGWAKDKILTGEIEKLLDKTDGSDYIYTISVQGHGDYPSQMPEGYTPEIKVEGFFDEDSEEAFEYYVNQLHEMDKFIGELVDMLSKRGEETVLVMYGDHLPGFSFTDDNLSYGDIYQTPYFIWDNIGLQREYKNIEAYQLTSYLFERLGITEGYINRYHQKYKYSEDYLKNLKILEYDILYGDHEIYGGENPYKATDMVMGTDEIKITKAYAYGDHVCVEGENFNDFSVVLVNEKEYPTVIVNGNMLTVEGVKLKAGDKVSVIQRGKDKIELSRVTLELTVDNTKP